MMSRSFLTLSRGTPAYLPCERSWRILVELFRRKNSKCWWYDFMVRGERYRGSTKQTTKTAAQARAAQIFTELANGSAYRTGRKVPYLSEIGVRFLTFVDNAKLADKSKAYLRNGWRLLQGTNIPAMRMD